LGVAAPRKVEQGEFGRLSGDKPISLFIGELPSPLKVDEASFRWKLKWFVNQRARFRGSRWGCSSSRKKIRINHALPRNLGVLAPAIVGRDQAIAQMTAGSVWVAKPRSSLGGRYKKDPATISG